MALPDYFARNAVAAAQILAGYDEERIRNTLQDVCVGITIGEDAFTDEGRVLVDLLVSLLARLYPTLAFRAQAGRPTESIRNLALRINPKIGFVDEAGIEVIVGSAAPAPTARLHIFAGA